MGAGNVVFPEVIEWLDESGKQMVQRVPQEGSGEIKRGGATDRPGKPGGGVFNIRILPPVLFITTLVGTRKGSGAKLPYLPFWRMKIRCEGMPLTSLAELVRIAYLPKPITPAMEEKQVCF
ncbi:MAG: hypothetical protein QG555_1279 [Thermodesulfobacteriota bacterium]|nr:hypothetical protein [Thermodesulfobacteriota bacterium]